MEGCDIAYDNETADRYTAHVFAFGLQAYSLDSFVKQVVYLSTSRTMLRPSEVMDILRVSRANNVASGLTGALLYAGGTFLQILEGDENAVDATLERIRCDPRHKGLIVMLAMPIETRSFPDWSMGLLRMDGLTEEDRAHVRSLTTMGDGGASRAHRLVRSFRSQLPLISA